jgi:hypothetical protein
VSHHLQDPGGRAGRVDEQVMLAMSLVVSIAAWRAETEAPTLTRANGPLFEAGTPGTDKSSPPAG